MAQPDSLEMTISQAVADAAAKGRRLTKEQALTIGAGFGVNLEEFDYCIVSPPGKSTFEIFYTGEKKPPVNPEDVPLDAVIAVKPTDVGMCPDHQAMMSINSNPKYKDLLTGQGKYIGWEAVVIDKWEELDPQKAQKQLQQLGYAGIELLTFSEVVRVEGGRRARERQALVFSPGKYSAEDKQRIMAQLRGEVLPGAAAQTYATSQAQQPGAPSAQVLTAPESGRQEGGIERLLPGGEIEVTQIILKITYNGNPANFEQIRYLNSVLQAAGLECAIDPNDPQKVEFRVRNYLKRPEATKEVEDKLRILVLLNYLTTMHVSSSIENFINQQVKDPVIKARLLGELPNYMSQQGRISEQQTL